MYSFNVINKYVHDVRDYASKDTSFIIGILYNDEREDDGRSISRKVSLVKILVHDIKNLLYYEQ